MNDISSSSDSDEALGKASSSSSLSSTSSKTKTDLRQNLVGWWRWRGRKSYGDGTTDHFPHGQVSSSGCLPVNHIFLSCPPPRAAKHCSV